jgi:probable phosphoglycerate mutase
VDRLILVRHAETAVGAAGLMHPDSRVETPLSPAGERAARALGAALAGEPIALAVCSPRLRARRTAELALEDRDVPVVDRPQLAEVAAGGFEGRPVRAYQRWVRGHPLDAAPTGGESLLAAAGRYVEGFRSLLAEPAPVVLAVVHNLPLRMVVNAEAGADPLAGPLQRVAFGLRSELAATRLAGAVDALAAWCAAAARARA